ncbi:uncharacterized protein LOC106457555 [Limulus polyphemus]|uniref:Uncharacterized protein LOC106457555 n=1 Tax=Limulus polyphemus TaxID=6850 RepID=A0ABM1S6K3_LIMPO|nr:uncharacterized protein LOC106457555 [Limulus polyphemus]
MFKTKSDSDNTVSEDCDVCGRHHYTSECPLLDACAKVKDKCVPSRARLTIPYNLEVIDLDDGIPRIFAKTLISFKSQFGPMEAPRTPLLEKIPNFFFKVFYKDGTSDFLDNSDENCCNWMCLVAPAKDAAHQNLIAYQFEESIYFSAQRDIKAQEELQVSYAPAYSKKIASSTESREQVQYPTDISNHGNKHVNSVGHHLSLRVTKQKRKCSSKIVSPEEEKVEERAEVQIDQNRESVSLNVVSKLDAEDLGVKFHPKQWICSQCSKKFTDCLAFAHHLQDHYKPTNSINSVERLSRQDTSTQIQLEDKNKYNTCETLEYKSQETTTIRRRSKIKFKEMLREEPVGGKRFTSTLKQCSSIVKRRYNLRMRQKVPDQNKDFVLTKQESNQKQLGMKNGHHEDKKLGRKFEEVGNSEENSKENKALFSIERSVKEQNDTDNDRTADSSDDDEDDQFIDYDSVMEDEESQHETNAASGNFAVTEKDFKATPTREFLFVLEKKRPVIHMLQNEKVNSHSSTTLPEAKVPDNVADSGIKANDKIVQNEIHRTSLPLSREAVQQEPSRNDSKENKEIVKRALVPRGEGEYECDLCGDRFNKPCYLYRHLKKHTGEFTCNHCYKVFARKESMMKHNCPALANTSSPENHNFGYRCETCNKSFHSKKSLDCHIARHTSRYSCKDCGRNYSSEYILNHHACPVHPSAEQFQCDICYKLFSQKKYLKKHLPIHTGEHTCDICGKWLRSTESLMSHVKSCSKVRKIEVNGKVKCQDCHQEFSDVLEFRKHQYEHTYKFKCDQCGSRFRDEDSVELHVCQPQDVCCKICDEVFPSFVSLQQHLTIHGDLIFRCTECGKSFYHQNSLLMHCCPQRGKKKLKITKTQSKEEKINRSTLLMCEICGSLFSNTSSLNVHKKLHGEKSFSCEICGKQFYRKDLLLEHTFIHQKASIPCPTCGKLFKSKKSLHIHIRIHNGVKMHKCSQCSREFHQKGNLLKHQESHDKNIKYTCDICFKSFKRKEYLSTHTLEHTRGRIYSCETCGKSFIKKYHVSEHMRIYHSNKSYVCKYCGIHIKIRQSLKRHLNKKHLEHSHELDDKMIEAMTVSNEFQGTSSLQKSRRKKSTQDKKILNDSKKCHGNDAEEKAKTSTDTGYDDTSDDDQKPSETLTTASDRNHVQSKAKQDRHSSKQERNVKIKVTDNKNVGMSSGKSVPEASQGLVLFPETREKSASIECIERTQKGSFVDNARISQNLIEVTSNHLEVGAFVELLDEECATVETNEVCHLKHITFGQDNKSLPLESEFEAMSACQQIAKQLSNDQQENMLGKFSENECTIVLEEGTVIEEGETDNDGNLLFYVVNMDEIH